MRQTKLIDKLQELRQVHGDILAQSHERLRTLEEAHANFVSGMLTRMSAVEQSMDELIKGMRALQAELAPLIHPAQSAQSFTNNTQKALSYTRPKSKWD
jgi:hypothetical protein